MEQHEKSVFISYSRDDELFALELAVEIENAIGKGVVWIDLFDLDAGDELAPKISGSIEKAKWFILVASKHSMASKWVKYEAHIATFMAIERDDIKILTVKIDDCSFPQSLNIELRRRVYIDATNDFKKGIHDVVNIISKEASTRSRKSHIFIDRGSEIDRLQLAAEH